MVEKVCDRICHTGGVCLSHQLAASLFDWAMSMMGAHQLCASACHCCADAVSCKRSGSAASSELWAPSRGETDS